MILRRVRAILVACAVGAAACGVDDDPPAQPTTTAPDDPADRPERWVGVDDAGRLVVVRSDGGQIERILATYDHPTDCPPPGEPAAGCEWLTGVAVSADGADVYYETCCEPAPGVIYRVAVEGGDREQVAHGAFPALAPEGERLAAVELQWVTVRDRQDPTGAVRFESSGAAAPLVIHGMTWSPDGERLAFVVYERTDEPGQLRLLDVATAVALTDAVPVPVAVAGDDRSPTWPTFRRDGVVTVADQVLELPAADGPVGPARVLHVDPGTGEAVAAGVVADGVRSQRYDGSGRHLLLVTGSGAVEWWTGPGNGAAARTVMAGSGFRLAAW